MSLVAVRIVTSAVLADIDGIGQHVHRSGEDQRSSPDKASIQIDGGELPPPETHRDMMPFAIVDVRRAGEVFLVGARGAGGLGAEIASRLREDAPARIAAAVPVLVR